MFSRVETGKVSAVNHGTPVAARPRGVDTEAVASSSSRNNSIHLTEALGRTGAAVREAWREARTLAPEAHQLLQTEITSELPE